jgi:hypothetical protein
MEINVHHGYFSKDCNIVFHGINLNLSFCNDTKVIERFMMSIL